MNGPLGFHSIHFMPVVNGKIEAENMRRLNVGGFHLTNFLFVRKDVFLIFQNKIFLGLVKSFALPAFTRMAAGGWPEASASRDHCTGAAAVSDFVKTAAMLLPVAQCINSISSRPVYFRPDAAVASPRPAIAGMSGKRSGASGDTVIDHPVVRLAVPVHRRPHLQTDACRCRHQRAMSRPRGQRPDAADSG